MKTELHLTAGASNTNMSLKQLVSNLVKDSLPAAIRNNTTIVNEVGQGICLGTGIQKTTSVIKDILATVVANSRKGEIHITARQQNGLIVLEIQERNNYNGYALSFSIGSIESDAVSAGGHISMKAPQQKVTTISFSFPVNLLAA